MCVCFSKLSVPVCIYIYTQTYTRARKNYTARIQASVSNALATFCGFAHPPNALVPAETMSHFAEQKVCLLQFSEIAASEDPFCTMQGKEGKVQGGGLQGALEAILAMSGLTMLTALNMKCHKF